MLLPSVLQLSFYFLFQFTLFTRFVMQFKIVVEVDDSVDAASWLKIDV